MKKLLVFLLVVVMILTLIGCGTEDVADPGDDLTEQFQEGQSAEKQSLGEQVMADIIEPEQIVTLQEAIAIMGTELVQGDKTDNEVVGQKLCEYKAADPEDFTMFQVSVNQLAFLPSEQIENGNTPENIYEITRDNFEETLEPVAGIGDDAFIDTPGLHLLYRGYYVVIALGNSDDPANIERLKTAGQNAAVNLDAILN